MTKDPFGEHLYQLLRRKGIRQVELARRMYVTQATISNYTMGINGPTVATLRRIKDAIGCTWEELLDEE